MFSWLSKSSPAWQAGREVKTELPRCLACGVCCHSKTDTYVRVYGEDWARLGADAERWACFIGNRAYLRMEQGHCAALRTSGAPAGQRAYFCTIYERRPRICRELEQGSPQCEAECVRKAGWVHGVAGAC